MHWVARAELPGHGPSHPARRDNPARLSVRCSGPLSPRRRACSRRRRPRRFCHPAPPTATSRYRRWGGHQTDTSRSCNVPRTAAGLKSDSRRPGLETAGARPAAARPKLSFRTCAAPMVPLKGLTAILRDIPGSFAANARKIFGCHLSGSGGGGGSGLGQPGSN